MGVGRKIYWLICEILFSPPHEKKRREKQNLLPQKHVLKNLPEQHRIFQINSKEVIRSHENE